MRVLETVMGIPMSIDIRDDGDHAATAERAFAVLRAADARFSRYLPDSELNAVNGGSVRPAALSAEFREVVAIGREAEAASAGAFRIRRPDGSYDLDGVVKGWAAARAARVLQEAGLRHVCLNAGGDVAVAGGPAPGSAWHVGVRSPDRADRMLAVLSVTDGAVATSGAYERGPHIVDGRTETPAAGLVSTTVVADDLTTADVLATAVFALGPDGPAWALAHGARGVIAVDAGGQVIALGAVTLAQP